MRLKLKMEIMGQYDKQRKFARLIGMDEARLSKIIRGFITPGTATMIEMASKLGVDDVENLFLDHANLTGDRVKK